MTSKTFSVLEKINDKEYVFSDERFREELLKYAISKKISKAAAKEEVADVCCVSESAVKNWELGKNGISDIGNVVKISNLFNIDYHNLLEVKKNSSINISESLQKTRTSPIDYNVKNIIEIFFNRSIDFAESRAKEEYAMATYDEDTIEAIKRSFEDPMDIINNMLSIINHAALNLPYDVWIKLHKICLDLKCDYLQGSFIYRFCSNSLNIARDLIYSYYNNDEIQYEKKYDTDMQYYDLIKAGYWVSFKYAGDEYVHQMATPQLEKDKLIDWIEAEIKKPIDHDSLKLFTDEWRCNDLLYLDIECDTTVEELYVFFFTKGMRERIESELGDYL